ncbi:hypothetical protein ACFQMM_18965 [Saliphagus sp. GCM10025308]
MGQRPFVDRAVALQWNFTGDALGILHYALGDADAFEATVADVPEVLDYDLVRDGVDAFYVYVRDDTTDALGELFDPVTQGGLVVIPPIRYREDGSVAFSIFGPDAEIQAAIEAVPDPIDVTVGGSVGCARLLRPSKRDSANGSAKRFEPRSNSATTRSRAKPITER